MAAPQPWPGSALSVAESRGQAGAAELAEMARLAAKEPLRSAHCVDMRAALAPPSKAPDAVQQWQRLESNKLTSIKLALAYESPPNLLLCSFAAIS